MDYMAHFVSIGIDKIFLYLLGAFLTGAYGYICEKLRREQKRQVAIKKGLQCVLKDTLIEKHDKWLERGFMPVYAREAFEEAYTSYKDLGADGVIDDLIAEVKTLPVHEMVRNNEQVN